MPDSIPLFDVDPKRRWIDKFLGTFSRFILILLSFATVAFVVMTFTPSAGADSATANGSGVATHQRVAFVLAALICGVAIAGLYRRLNKTWAWSKLPTNGSILIRKPGLIIKHDGVLDREIRIPWDNIRAITLDSGRNHDDQFAWRRFPIPSPTYDRRYLFDTASNSANGFSLIASRPVAPNIAILLDAPIALHNPNYELTSIAFSDKDKAMQPPAFDAKAAGLFLRTQNLKQTRELLLRTGKLRALKASDVD